MATRSSNVRDAREADGASAAADIDAMTSTSTRVRAPRVRPNGKPDAQHRQRSGRSSDRPPSRGSIPSARRSRQPVAPPPSLRLSLATLLRVSDNLVTRAVRAYDRLVALDDQEEANLCVDLGHQFLADGRDDEAAQLFRKATAMDPHHVDAWTSLGRLYLARRAPKAAIDAMKRALEMGVESARLHRTIAEALHLQNDLEGAQGALERAVELEPDEPAHLFELGLVHDARNNYEAAVGVLQRAVELDPENISYHQRLGFALESAGRRGEAVKCFKVALKLETSAGR